MTTAQRKGERNMNSARGSNADSVDGASEIPSRPAIRRRGRASFPPNRCGRPHRSFEGCGSSCRPKRTIVDGHLPLQHACGTPHSEGLVLAVPRARESTKHAGALARHAAPRKAERPRQDRLASAGTLAPREEKLWQEHRELEQKCDDLLTYMKRPPLKTFQRQKKSAAEWRTCLFGSSGITMPTGRRLIGFQNYLLKPHVSHSKGPVPCHGLAELRHMGPGGNELCYRARTNLKQEWPLIANQF